MNTLEKFLTNCLVIKIDNLEDIDKMILYFKERGITRIKDFNRVCNGNYSWMLNNVPLNELCLEYQMGKGFTISGKTDNLKYGNEVISWNEFVQDTTIESL